MDQVAFHEGTQRRPLVDSVGLLLEFFEARGDSVVEGCYGDIAEAIAQQIDLFIFLNPGIETCLRHCAQRPWEPDKFESPEAQEAMRESLLEWVASYDERADEYGLRSHRKVFDAFPGHKRELKDPADYRASVLALLASATGPES